MLSQGLSGCVGASKVNVRISLPLSILNRSCKPRVMEFSLQGVQTGNSHELIGDLKIKQLGPDSKIRVSVAYQEICFKKTDKY